MRLSVYFYIVILKRFVANFYILFSFHLPATCVPRKLNIQGFLDKTTSGSIRYN